MTIFNYLSVIFLLFLSVDCDSNNITINSNSKRACFSPIFYSPCDTIETGLHWNFLDTTCYSCPTYDGTDVFVFFNDQGSTCYYCDSGDVYYPSSNQCCYDYYGSEDCSDPVETESGTAVSGTPSCQECSNDIWGVSDLNCIGCNTFYIENFFLYSDCTLDL
jgi:hypothetical protein